MEENQKNNNSKRDRIGMILYFLYGFFLLLSVGIIAKIVLIKTTFKVDPDLEYIFTPSSTKSVTEPRRGTILDSNGKILALSTPMYQVYMDCSILKYEYSQMSNGEEKELMWRGKARELCDSLSALYQDKTPDEYYKFIISARERRRRHEKIGFQIDHGTLQRVKKFPLFNEGANKGGLIVESNDTRQYPYGSLAKRLIGYAKDADKSNGNNLVGLEGKFNSELHGIAGIEWLKPTDKRKNILNLDSTRVQVQNGKDLRTTLDINIQDIADRALRRQIADDPLVEGGCLVVMEVATGAIKAMVNLNRDTTTNTVNETYNWAVGRAGEPGSVFKTVTLTTLLEDKVVKSVEEKIPILKGKYRNYNYDQHLAEFGYNNKTDSITIREALQISSNQAFCYLTVENYETKPKAFLDKLYMYKLGEAFAFDLDGLKTPTIQNPDSPSWSATDLGVTAFGYGVTETPLHILMFYNAIANDGKMMKPYLVESLEKDGKVTDRRDPIVLNASICSKATADTVKRALRAVVTDGTGKTKLGKAKLNVAGKTGTSRVALEAGVARPGDAYHDIRGRMQNQGTFVGFFPYENPKYSIIAVVYSTLSHTSYYGGTKPAEAVNETVNGMYSLLDVWDEPLKPVAAVPAMLNEAPEYIPETSDDKIIVPDVTGLGLQDAVRIIEKSGLKCSFSGVGHVSQNGQSPAAGKAVAKGSTVTIKLK